MIGLMLPEEEMPTAQENLDILNWLVKYWHLGPEVGSAKPGDNKPFWSELALVWNIPEDDARNQLCANCEYFSDSPKMLKAMDVVPFNKYDATGGGRGYCSKFDFICHNLRVCQAWEPQESEEDSCNMDMGD